MPGEVIGEVGLLEDGPPFRLNSVAAVFKSELLELRPSEFGVVREEYPDIYRAFTDMVHLMFIYLFCLCT